jgi:hypothetical protein
MNVSLRVKGDIFYAAMAALILRSEHCKTEKTVDFRSGERRFLDFAVVIGPQNDKERSDAPPVRLAFNELARRKTVATAGTTYSKEPATHMKAPAAIWSLRGDNARTRGASAYEG